MKPIERGIRFSCNGESLVGVLALPVGDPANVGVVVAVGGPQYRAGSHRQFALLSRRLARAGYAVLRFDARGMGDSTGEFPGFEALGPDIDASVRALMGEVPTVRRVVLWGLCDAASAVLMNATSLPQLAGMVLLNPWVRHADTEARTQVRQYYGRRLFEPAFWRKLLAGQVKVGTAFHELSSKLQHIWRSRKSAVPATLDYRDRMARGALDCAVPQLYVLSGRDHVSAEFLEFSSTHPELPTLWKRAYVARLDLSSADHTFSSSELRGQVEDATLAWLDRVAGRTPG